MKPAVFFWGMAVLAGATLAGGLIHGRVSRRWEGQAAMRQAAENLQALPDRIGPWESVASRALAPRAAAMLQCAGHVGREYRNRRTGEMAVVMVLLGPAGPISVHTPDVCYTGGPHVIRQQRQQVAVGDQGDAFWNILFQSTTTDAGFLRVYYAWGSGGLWSAPEDARFAFAGQPYLYKLQVESRLLSPADEKAADSCPTFLKDFLPELKKCLAEPVKE
jgi:hypothetical protein